jgi:hypothetical protein
MNQQLMLIKKDPLHYREDIEELLQQLTVIDDNCRARMAMIRRGYGPPPAVLDHLRQTLTSGLCQLAQFGIYADCLEEAVAHYQAALREPLTTTTFKEESDEPQPKEEPTFWAIHYYRNLARHWGLDYDREVAVNGNLHFTNQRDIHCNGRDNNYWDIPTPHEIFVTFLHKLAAKGCVETLKKRFRDLGGEEYILSAKRFSAVKQEQWGRVQFFDVELALKRMEIDALREVLMRLGIDLTQLKEEQENYDVQRFAKFIDGIRQKIVLSQEAGLDNAAEAIRDGVAQQIHAEMEQSLQPDELHRHREGRDGQGYLPKP